MSNDTALTNQKASRLVALIDYLDIAAIFVLFYSQVLHRFLEAIGRYIFFPIAAIGGLIQATLAWRQAKLDGYSKSAVTKALVETGTALAINLAVIGALAFSAIFAFVAPIIFACALGFKALYQLGTAIYHGEKALVSKIPEEREQHKKLAKENAISSLVNISICTAILAVIVLGKVILAGIGIAAGVLGASFAAYKIHQMLRPPKNKVEAEINATEELTNNAKMTKALSQPSNTVQLDPTLPNTTTKGQPENNAANANSLFTEPKKTPKEDSGIIGRISNCAVM